MNNQSTSNTTSDKDYFEDISAIQAIKRKQTESDPYSDRLQLLQKQRQQDKGQGQAQKRQNIGITKKTLNNIDRLKELQTQREHSLNTSPSSKEDKSRPNLQTLRQKRRERIQQKVKQSQQQEGKSSSVDNIQRLQDLQQKRQAYKKHENHALRKKQVLASKKSSIDSKKDQEAISIKKTDDEKDLDLLAIRQKRLKRAKSFHHLLRKNPEKLKTQKPQESQKPQELPKPQKPLEPQELPKPQKPQESQKPVIPTTPKKETIATQVDSSGIKKDNNLPQSLKENLDHLQANKPPQKASQNPEISTLKADQETIERAKQLSKEILESDGKGHETLKIPEEALPPESELTPEEKAKINQQEAKVLPKPEDIARLESENERQKIIKETGDILQKDLIDTSQKPPQGIYMELPANLQQQFKETGEQIARDIASIAMRLKQKKSNTIESKDLKPVMDRILQFFKSLFIHKKSSGIDVEAIYNQILLWLKMIPNISDVYLEQLAKNKTDEVILYLKSLQ